MHDFCLQPLPSILRSVLKIFESADNKARDKRWTGIVFHVHAYIINSGSSQIPAKENVSTDLEMRVVSFYSMKKLLTQIIPLSFHPQAADNCSSFVAIAATQHEINSN